MDFGPWLLGAGTVLATQALTLIADRVRRGWVEKGEAARRIEERSDRAAETLLDLLEEGRRLLPHDPDKVPQTDVYALCHRIEREALLLRDASARETMKAASDILWHADTSIFGPEYSPLTVAWLCANEGREVLGALLRREPVTGVPPKLRELAGWVKDVYEPDEAASEKQ